MTHLIQRLNLEFNSSHQEAPGSRLKRVSDWANGELSRCVERTMDSWPLQDHDVLIERLDLEVELASWDDWENQLLPAIERQFSSALRERLAKDDAGSALSAAGERSARTVPTLLQALVYYLHHGHLPWYQTISAALFVQHVRAELRRTPARDLVTRLLPALGTSTARARLIALLDEAVLEGLLQAFLPQAAPVFSSLLQANLARARAAHGPRPSTGELERAHWLALIEYLSVEVDIAPGATEVAPWTQQAAVAHVERQIEALGYFASNSAEQGAQGAPDQDGQQEAVHTRDRARGAGIGSDARALNSAPRASQPMRQVEHYIDHAGLILLAPYLPTYLTRLGLAEPKRILNPAGALVAVHHLATGSPAVPQEFELSLVRILCGQEEQDLPHLSPPDIAVQAESESLLRSVIEHWSALKKTSPEGLREAFLSRPGKLVRTEQGNYRLLVEPAAYDILLAHLPWTFRTVQLPWMPQLLRTEWAD